MTIMDEQVLRGMARWPDVPAVFGWLSLDRRGNWLLQGDPIANPTVAAYIGRNYDRDGEGRWFFQNGPQRVYVELDYTPHVYRATRASDGALEIASHAGARARLLSGAFIDETGALLVETDLGPGLVHDRDLETILPCLVDEDGRALDENALESAMAELQNGRQAHAWMRYAASNVKLEPLRSEAVAARFGYVRHPS